MAYEIYNGETRVGRIVPDKEFRKVHEKEAWYKTMSGAMREVGCEIKKVDDN